VPAGDARELMFDAVLFDLGKVLLDWSPRYYYAQFFTQQEQALEHFLTEVVAPDWILEMDRGTPTDEAVASQCERFPNYAELIRRWPEGWPLMLRGEIPGTVEILAKLRTRGTRLYALTNFSCETWPIARERFPFLGWFQDVIVSGEVGLVKPDPRIFTLAIARCHLTPACTVFIDDLAANVAAAHSQGLHALHFVSPEKLHTDLSALGLL
jgi:2-haloacid dehalogenase